MGRVDGTRLKGAKNVEPELFGDASNDIFDLMWKQGPKSISGIFLTETSGFRNDAVVAICEVFTNSSSEAFEFRHVFIPFFLGPIWSMSGYKQFVMYAVASVGMPEFSDLMFHAHYRAIAATTSDVLSYLEIFRH
ncbi:hypothetical protein [Novosphingobium kaempferiae]|uniref:hypothetical protein n=1 Tax=Novosphingobium kaempferiae TaxID=2896849 RepID=UPI001E535CAA|nr:hypothetical protein [Novosphingobium kaempferiae]